MRYDCVVIGAGLAGLTAAVRLTEMKLRPVVVAKGTGGLYLGGATIDVLGYSGLPVDSPAVELGPFHDAHPDHPYPRLAVEQIDAALGWLRDRVPGYEGGLSENMLIPTAVGVAKPTAVTPTSIAAGNLRSGGDMLLAGFTSLKDFYPHLAADNLGRREVGARGIEINLSPDGEPDVNTIRFGRAFDDPGFRKVVVDALRPRLDGCDRVGLPAVVGIRDPDRAWNELQDALGVAVFEIPTLPPSIPGIRLHESLAAQLRAGGGRLILNNTVVDAQSSGKRLNEVVVDNGSRRVSIPTRAVILATGGVAAGGIEMNSRWDVYEPALRLPVSGVPEPSERRFDPDLHADHPLSTAGVTTDARLRPVDGSGAVVYENAFVAGATLAGARPWHEGSGNGISLATGYAAAGHAAEEIAAWN